MRRCSGHSSGIGSRHDARIEPFDAPRLRCSCRRRGRVASGLHAAGRGVAGVLRVRQEPYGLAALVDPAALALLGPAYLVGKVLGPTADYIGEGVKDWTERRSQNVKAVFDKAGRKLGDELDEPGGVPPRVLKGVLEEGQFAEDDLAREYLGGVLASSRTSTARDDRAASLVGVVGRLSTYSLRMHYLLYAAARPRLIGTAANLGLDTERKQEAKLYVSFTTLIRGFDLSDEEHRNFGGILSHTLHALLREDLLEHEFFLSSGEQLRLNQGGKAYDEEGGLIYVVSPLGMELFCHAHGVRRDFLTAYTDPAITLEVDAKIDLGAGAQRFMDMPPWTPPQAPNVDP